MAKFSNDLTDAEAERLAIFQEECGEAIVEASKTERHGYKSFNPFDPEKTTNRARLTREVGDILAAIDLMIAAGDLDLMEVADAKAKKATTYHHRLYTHHQ